MCKSARLRFLVLALLVALSHVALISHVTAHFQPALEQCELCVSQAHPLAAVPVAETAAYCPSAAVMGWPEPATRPAAAGRERPYHQRAPPAASS
jgi:hypothetical protein